MESSIATIVVQRGDATGPIRIGIAPCDDPSPDVAMLLADRNYNASLLATLAATPPSRLSWAGLFCADPFLNKPQLFRQLAELQITGIMNFPSVGSYGADFHRQLADVGFSLEREAAFLSEARDSGFDILACVPGDSDRETLLGALGQLDPDGWLIHCGLSAIQQRAGSPVISPDWLGQLPGERYLYQPGVDLEDLPDGYHGLASASWWR